MVKIKPFFTRIPLERVEVARALMRDMFATNAKYANGRYYTRTFYLGPRDRSSQAQTPKRNAVAAKIGIYRVTREARDWRGKKFHDGVLIGYV